MAAKFPETFSLESGEEEDERPELSSHGEKSRKAENKRERKSAYEKSKYDIHSSSVRACKSCAFA
jgi:hypothetical protein